MIMTEEIKTKSGLKLLVEKRSIDNQVEVSLRMKNKRNCLLHWGVCRHVKASWQIPPQSLWPEGTRASGKAALQTPFLSRDGDSQVIIRLDQPLSFPVIDFALFFPEENRWDNNHGKNYHIKLPVSEKPSLSLVQILRDEIKEHEVFFEEVFNLEKRGQLAAAVTKDGSDYWIIMVSDIPGHLILHWGVAYQAPNEWSLPPASIRPEGTVTLDNTAAQTPFLLHERLNHLKIKFKEKEAPPGIPFIVKQIDTGRWLKNRGHNFYIPIGDLSQKGACLEPSELSGLAEEIIQAEMGDHSWTLMHRFNLCHDLLDRVRNDLKGLALLFVWLRFSAIRQLDWQRNYNTQPRELSHSQDRLTLKLATIYIGNDPKNRELVRLMLTTLGRGGEGQRIRDEILNIMHRHKIKEVTGHFMEEWHQKLHNNATPDDIVICEAYVEFLKSDGTLDIFYKTLETGGVPKKRLENFERPIVTDPDFVPHLKDGLIHDFENYLKLLKSIHSGTDLESAINAANYLFDSEMRHPLDFILQHRGGSDVSPEDLTGKVTEVRHQLNKRLDWDRENGNIRDLLFLDLALEDFLRVVVERSIHSHLSGDQLVDLIGMVLENLRLSHDDDELTECSLQWERLKEMPRFSQDWSLHAKSVIDRLGRTITAFIDFYYQLLQPKAESLGKAFHADSWTITLFSEEVVRGRPAFVLSMLLRHIDPMLRKAAKLGNWQVISPGQAMGQVEVVDTLKSIQGRTFDSPTVVIAEKVMGDEEPPEGVTAIVTPDVTDIVSHVAVRARNSHLLFATCYDCGMISHLKSKKGHWLHLSVNPSGDVVVDEERTDTSKVQRAKQRVENLKIERPAFFTYAVSSKDFNENVAGGKSNNLIGIKGNLPEWIRVPSSVALPFGVFEKVLNEKRNREISERYRDLINLLDDKPEGILNKLQEAMLSLEPPDALIGTLERVMTDEGLGWPEKWDDAWRCIKSVWASKWNERAYLSREARGIPHEDLFMAVLVQEVVEADYAFVIHTANPFTGDRDELYAEVVLGLGETLVGNYPGRALCFTSKKESQEAQVLAYPSKSTGLFGSGLIFRSDSNGEDLAGYAGAGLYDSFMLVPPRKVSLDYTNEPLVWDEDFRKNLMIAISKIGIAVEDALGCAQDIEGAYRQGKYCVVQTRPQVGLEECRNQK